MKQVITERDFATQVEDLLTRFGWRWCHFRPARVMKRGEETYRTALSGDKGFLDYLALRPPRIVVAELKNNKAKMTLEQQEWFDLWERCQRTVVLQPLEIAHRAGIVSTSPEVYLWRPDDFDKIVECLR